MATFLVPPRPLITERFRPILSAEVWGVRASGVAFTRLVGEAEGLEGYAHVDRAQGSSARAWVTVVAATVSK